MRFVYPLFPAEFEIPDDWWNEAGMRGFTPSCAAYRSTAAATDFIPLEEIEPLFRNRNHENDLNGFRRAALIKILKRFAADEEIDPVSLLILPAIRDITSRSPFRYRIL